MNKQPTTQVLPKRNASGEPALIHYSVLDEPERDTERFVVVQARKISPYFLVFAVED
jgi:hypothetical protein